MSQSTPAKQDRVERHLMRQRGAGVRAVTANFGFSFGALGLEAEGGEEKSKNREGNAVGSVEFTAAVSRGVNLVEHATVGTGQELEDSLANGKRAGAKRKANFEDDAVINAPRGKVDDSFDAALESRKRPVKRARKDVEPMPVVKKRVGRAKKVDMVHEDDGNGQDVPGLVEPARPETERAAKKPARGPRKVLERPVEEKMMVDNRVSGPSKPAVKKQSSKRKKVDAPEQHSEVVAAPFEMNDKAPEPTTKRVGRTRQPVTTEDIAPNNTEITVEGVPKPTKKPTARRKKAEPTESHITTAMPEAAPCKKAALRGHNPAADKEPCKVAPLDEPKKTRQAKSRKAVAPKENTRTEEPQASGDAAANEAALPTKRSRAPPRKAIEMVSITKSAVGETQEAGDDDVDELSAEIVFPKNETRNTGLPKNDGKATRDGCGQSSVQVARDPVIHELEENAAPEPSERKKPKRAAPRKRGKAVMQAAVQQDADQISDERPEDDDRLTFNTDSVSQIFREPELVTATVAPKRSRVEIAALKTGGKKAAQEAAVEDNDQECSARAASNADQCDAGPKNAPDNVTAIPRKRSRVVKRTVQAVEQADVEVPDKATPLVQQEDTAPDNVKRRQPLAESNANRSIMSVSPEKRSPEKPPLSLSKNEQKPSEPKLQAPKKTNRTTYQDSQRNTAVAHPPTPPASQEVQPGNNDGEEEDIDWLFAPQERKAPPVPQQSSRVSKPARSMKRTADLDLDDLLSNIATFAGERQAANSTAPPVSRSKASARTAGKR
ncbi:hypothetical protein MBLNU230_g2617t1 [Neophaeotheca triangularis]